MTHRPGKPEPENLGHTAFATTQWSMVLAAGHDSAPDARAALEQLCRTYWHPLYAFLRRSGHSASDAEDLIQGFFAYVLEKRSLARADRERGRFRSFLLGSLKHFLANERDKALTQKRGGNRTIVPLDGTGAEAAYDLEADSALSPEKSFDRRWALAVIARAKRRVQLDFQAKGRAELFSALEGHLGGQGDEPVKATAARLNLTLAATKSAIHRLRQEYYAAVRDEIAQTVGDPTEVDEEIRHLLTALRE